MTIGERLRNRRESLGLTLEQVGDYIGVGRATVQRYESNAIDIKRTVAIKLAEILKTTPAYIMGWEDTPSSPAPQENKAHSSYSPLEQEIIKAYRAAPPVLQEAVLNVLHIPIPASNVRQKKNA